MFRTGKHQLLQAVALALLLVPAFAGCGGGGSEGGNRAQEIVEDATFHGIHSSEIGATLGLLRPAREEHFSATATGMVMASGNPLPEIDEGLEISGTVNGREVGFFGGLLVNPKQLIINYEQETYGVGGAGFAGMKGEIEEAQQEGGEGALAACVDAADGLSVSDLVAHFRSEGTSHEGDEIGVTTVTGTVDVPAAVAALVKITEDPACRAQVEAGGYLPVAALSSYESWLLRSVHDGRVEFKIGTDHILRELGLEFTISPRGDHAAETEVDFRLRLGSVNAVQGLPEASPAKPLSTLLKKLGVSSYEELRQKTFEGAASLIAQGLGLSSSDGSQ